MTRQFVNCPGSEAHAARLEHIKTLGTIGAGRQYLNQVRAEHGDFWARYLEDDFTQWLKARKAVA